MGKVIGIAVLVGLVFGGAYFFNMQKGSGGEQSGDVAGSTVDQDVVYYYGEECPHCQDVMKFLEENKIAEKVKFEKKEVWHNKKNAAEMNGKAKECGLDPKEIGVPFLFAEGKCHIGTPDVEAYFKKAAGI